MREQFTENLRLSRDNQDKLHVVNNIIQDYANQGYKLTLRQLYYQLVSKAIIPNSQAEYKKLGTLLVKGRMAGIVDWDAIEDRIRVPQIPYWVNGVDDALEDTINHYRLDRQKGQDSYIEVWCEKDALSGILSKVTEKYHIKLMVNRGYSSATAMYKASKRFLWAGRQDKELHILYLGDHDPSGIDMIRDVEDRLFGFGANVNVDHIALTQEQIGIYDPPPNPAKISDPRADWYIQVFGEVSWEVDALTPQVLNNVLTEHILDLIDEEQYKFRMGQEEVDKRKIQGFIDDNN